MITYKQTSDTFTGEITGICGTEPGCTFVFNPNSNSVRAKAYKEWLAEGNTPLPPDQPDLWEEIRQKRDQLIRDSDWTMIPGATVDQAQWSAYRQILRDLPQTYSNPEDVVWPTTPSTSGPNTIEE